MGCSNGKIHIKTYKDKESNKIIIFENKYENKSSSDNHYFKNLKEENKDKKE